MDRTIRWAGTWAALWAVGCGGGDFASQEARGAGGEAVASGGAGPGGSAELAAQSRGSGGVVTMGGAGSAPAETGGSGTGGASEPLCVPGKSEQCVGPGGCAGGQACKADGSGFDECVCSAMGAGGEPADAGPKIVTTGMGDQWICGLSKDNPPTSCSCFRRGTEPSTFCATNDCSIGYCPTLTEQCCLRSADSSECICHSSSVCTPDIPAVSCPS